jgi:acyl-CoA dehydrogenase
MRRILALARDFASRRVAFGKKVNELPLQIQVLADLEKRYRGNLLFVLNAAKLLGKIENDLANDSEKLLHRVMTPCMKLFTAKESVAFVSEGVEAFGAMGYMENSGIPVILRDAQVLPIWEGTTNVLALDLTRALQRD